MLFFEIFAAVADIAPPAKRVSAGNTLPTAGIATTAPMARRQAHTPSATCAVHSYLPEFPLELRIRSFISLTNAMKILSSLKSAKKRHRDCKIVRRRGKVFVICKSNPRFKARQR